MSNPEFTRGVVFDAALAVLETFAKANGMSAERLDIGPIEELLELDPETSPEALLEVSAGKSWPNALPRERLAFTIFRETYVTLHRQRLAFEKMCAAEASETEQLERRSRTRQPERDVFERVGRFGDEKIGDERLGKQFTPAAWPAPGPPAFDPKAERTARKAKQK